MINHFSLFQLRGELAFLAELHEQATNFSRKGRPDIAQFIQWWKEKGVTVGLSVPEKNTAITILTIHRSKGLQFPVVIIPYFSWPIMKFESYHILNEIKRSLAQMGFNRPTDIQFKAIPPILAGEDVLAIAQTGTGKTAAFAIPVIHNIGSRKAQATTGGIKCVVMEPTRELALQVTQVFQEIGQFTKVNTFCVFGGVEQDPQIEQLQNGVDILVVTPGRMFDLVSQGFINLNVVEVLILDEADHMMLFR